MILCPMLYAAADGPDPSPVPALGFPVAIDVTFPALPRLLGIPGIVLPAVLTHLLRMLLCPSAVLLADGFLVFLIRAALGFADFLRICLAPPALLLGSLLFVLLVIPPTGFPDLVPVLLLVPSLDLARLLRVSSPPALQLLICGLGILVRHQPVLSRAEPCAVAREQEAIPWQSR